MTQRTSFKLKRTSLALAGTALALAGMAAPAFAANFQYRHLVYGLTAPVSPPPPAQQAAAAEIVVALTGGPSLPVGQVSQAYSYDLKQLLTITGDGAWSPSSVSWELLSGSLPQGLTLGANGTISGTPTTAGEERCQDSGRPGIHVAVELTGQLEVSHLFEVVAADGVDVR